MRCQLWFLVSIPGGGEGRGREGGREGREGGKGGHFAEGVQRASSNPDQVSDQVMRISFQIGSVACSFVILIFLQSTYENQHLFVYPFEFLSASADDGWIVNRCSVSIVTATKNH